MISKGPTLKQIADNLGLSISTVSRALRGMPEINIETREAVIEYSKKLKYKLPSVNNSSPSDQAYLIGVIVPQLNEHFRKIISGIDSAASEAGFSVIIAVSNNSYGRELTLVTRLLNHKVDGFIVCQSAETTSFDHFHKIQKFNRPLIFIEKECKDVIAPTFLIDHNLGVGLATDHLLEKGYKKICFLGAAPYKSSKYLPENGFLEKLFEKKVPDFGKKLIFGDFDNETAFNKTLELLKLPDRPDAFIASNDLVAAGILNAIKEVGFNIPKDIGLIGYFNEPLGQALSPKLTTVGVPANKLGKIAVNSLIEQVHLGIDQNPQITTLEPELILRETTNIQRRFFGLG